MPNRSRKPAKQDVAQTAFRVMLEATGQAPPTPPPEQPKKNPAAVELGRLGGLKGGKARAAKLTPKKRSERPKKCLECHKPEMRLGAKDHTADMKYDGRTYSVTVLALPVLMCSNCNAIAFTSESMELLSEKLRLQAGLWKPMQIKAFRESLELTQDDFGRLLSVAGETVCRWERGAQIQQASFDAMMKNLKEVPESLAWYSRRTKVHVPGLESAPRSKTVTMAAKVDKDRQDQPSFRATSMAAAVSR